jgi:hypothetical protein
LEREKVIQLFEQAAAQFQTVFDRLGREEPDAPPPSGTEGAPALRGSA